MKFEIGALLIIVALSKVVRCDFPLLIDQLRRDFLEVEKRLWKFVSWEVPNLDKDESEHHLIDALYLYDQTLKVPNLIPENVLKGVEPLRKIHAFLFLYAEVKHTENMYHKFRRFLEEQIQLYNSSFNDKVLLKNAIETEDIVRDILNPKIGVNITVHKVYDLTFGEENMIMEIFDLMIKDYQCKDYLQSPQQVFYNLYNVIALNGLKSYIMMQFAYLIGRISEKENHEDLADITRVHFERRVNETMSVFRGSMEIAPAEVWRCDPKQHAKGSTYEDFTRLIQGHIQNEVDMNLGGTCRENCAAYPISTSRGCYDSDSKYCREMERCTGKIHNCRFIESHMDICPSKSPTRRYDFIQYKSGRTMGKSTKCWKKPINSWWRWFVHCSYCLCLCDEQGPKSDRFVNMRPVLSGVDKNRVVTGLRFAKQNRIIHLQVQEGKLLEYGYIDNNTVRWVPVEDYKITDRGIYNAKDYYTMTYDSRAMALDDLEMVQENYVVTGVRFQFIENKLRFQMRVSVFDWKTGLISEKSSWIYRVNGGKNKIDLNKVDIPTNSPSSEIKYDSDLYVEFTHTDFDADAAQTTVPFFDLQPVTTHPQVPLMGAGIYYKGRTGFGGFIAPKIKTVNFSTRMNFVGGEKPITEMNVPAN